MSLAPIVLFVYNRPEHTKQTVESLKKNLLAEQSELFIFSDGPRNKKDHFNVEAVRAYIDTISGFRNIAIERQTGNSGLAPSVIAGVSSIIRRYGKAIVIEDDLLFSPHFLTYMNQSLDCYFDDPAVFSIGGYSPSLDIPNNYRADSYLSYRCCTWGWATWADRWEKVDWDVKDFDSFIKNREHVEKFNRGGDDMSKILKLQMEGKVSSWGIRWDYAHYKNNAFCFRPTHSIVANIGNDGTGVHCGTTDKFDIRINVQPTFDFPKPGNLLLDEELNQRFATFYDGRKRDLTIKGPVGGFAMSLRRLARGVRKLMV